ncbi:hypothetical protein EK21DRAFT_118175 [Setomelanomma holmii]|uniref:Uncharacterized protein n=1 Tax=Setomelanomma holmii TaxID=210430 RepID=A0A9P4GXY6_9PLEO|nr:hypothetical protein EK21DRAFT_118175 [Setomelanomma holmii]
MARRNAPRTTYEKIDVDSGYLSDLVAESRRTDEAAADLFNSSSCRKRGSLAMTAFDDTEWDVPASKARNVSLDRLCRDLAKQIRKPIRFPITPLDSTLARMTDEQRRRAPIQRHIHVTDAAPTDSNSLEASPTITASADRYGRTRAAARQLAATTSRVSGSSTKFNASQPRGYSKA